ncbi:MAG: erythromycin esterase family protein [Saprospiraceae bacterium]|nr:erythromycin esterase family protein [Lewinella sp.]
MNLFLNQWCTLRGLTLLSLFFLLPSCKKPTVVEMPEQTEDENGLLTDAGLDYPLDIIAPEENPDWVSGALANYQPIRSLTSDASFEDLRFLEPLLEGVDIVQLGESCHGVQQFNQVKTRIIKYLHEDLGFNVIAFESGFFDCAYTNENLIKPNAIANYLMESAIFDVWHTAEVEELFEYIAETRATDHPLVLAGFDIQFSSDSGRYRAAFFRDLLERFDAAYAEEIYAFDTNYQNRYRKAGFVEYLEENLESITTQYSDLADFFEALLEKNGAEPLLETTRGQIMIAHQTAKNVANNAVMEQYYNSGAVQTSSELRDHEMANNLINLKEHIYPNEKIIVWAHNFHIRHNHAAVSGPVYTGYSTMGLWLHEYFSEKMYTVGLYMYTGKAAHNDQRIFAVSAAKSGSLESIMHRTLVKYSFLDFRYLPTSVENVWVSRPLFSKHWGTTDMTMVHNAQYDGIIFIQDVRPPKYLR